MALRGSSARVLRVQTPPDNGRCRPVWPDTHTTVVRGCRAVRASSACARHRPVFLAASRSACMWHRHGKPKNSRPSRLSASVKPHAGHPGSCMRRARAWCRRPSRTPISDPQPPALGRYGAAQAGLLRHVPAWHFLGSSGGFCHVFCAEVLYSSMRCTVRYDAGRPAGCGAADVGGAAPLPAPAPRPTVPSRASGSCCPASGAATRPACGMFAVPHAADRLVRRHRRPA